MKRKPTIFQKEETEINVSPLIDMVFILLIFFIVATSFVNEVGIPGCSAADNETCATFRRHSRRQGTEQSMQ